MTTSVRRPSTSVRAVERRRRAGPGAESEHQGPPPSGTWSALAALTPGVAAVAAAATLWWPGVLTGPPAMNGSARGTALVVLLLAVPLVVATAFPPGRRSVPVRAACAGGLAYLTYNAVLFVFATPFNRLFLLYVAMLGLAGWTLAGRTGPLLRHRQPVGRRSRAVAVYVAVVALANTLLWLRGIVPAVTGPRPTAATDGMGVATNPVWVQDLAFWLPASFVVAVGLWRRRGWSRPLGTALLVYWFLEAVSIAVDQWMGARADPGSAVVSAQLVPGFAVLALVTLVPLAALLRAPAAPARGPARRSGPPS